MLLFAHNVGLLLHRGRTPGTDGNTNSRPHRWEVGSSALNLGPQKVYSLSSTQNATKALGFSGTHSSPTGPRASRCPGHSFHCPCHRFTGDMLSAGRYARCSVTSHGSLSYLLQAFAQHHLLTKTIVKPLLKITFSLASEALNTTCGFPRATCSPPVQVSPHRWPSGISLPSLTTILPQAN